jgi:transcriptional regulator with XRE-family HTH domain
MPLEDRVRARLRQARFERGLSLQALARRAGLATSTVSRLETGARRLTLAHVSGLARALDLSTDDLLADRPPAREPGRDGKTWTPVGPERTGGPRVFHVGIPAGLDRPVLHSHEGFQWLYVMDGRVRVIVEQRDRVLQVGEAAAFQTWRPHWVGAVDGAAQLLVIFTADGRPFSAAVDPA